MSALSRVFRIFDAKREYADILVRLETLQRLGVGELRYGDGPKGSMAAETTPFV